MISIQLISVWIYVFNDWWESFFLFAFGIIFICSFLYLLWCRFYDVIVIKQWKVAQHCCRMIWSGICLICLHHGVDRPQNRWAFRTLVLVERVATGQPAPRVPIAVATVWVLAELSQVEQALAWVAFRWKRKNCNLVRFK